MIDKKIIDNSIIINKYLYISLNYYYIFLSISAVYYVFSFMRYYIKYISLIKLMILLCRRKYFYKPNKND